MKNGRFRTIDYLLIAVGVTAVIAAAIIKGIDLQPANPTFQFDFENEVIIIPD